MPHARGMYENNIMTCGLWRSAIKKRRLGKGVAVAGAGMSKFDMFKDRIPGTRLLKPSRNAVGFISRRRSSRDRRSYSCVNARQNSWLFMSLRDLFASSRLRVTDLDQPDCRLYGFTSKKNSSYYRAAGASSCGCSKNFPYFPNMSSALWMYSPSTSSSEQF